MDITDRRQLLHRFAGDFARPGRPVVTVDGGLAERRRVYLDTTATALMPRPVWAAMEDYLTAASANSHTEAHRAGRDTTAAIAGSRAAIGRLVGYDPVRDVVIFTSNGATGAINFLARALFPPEIRALVKRFPAGCPPRWHPRGPGEVAGRHRRLLARLLAVTTQMEHHPTAA
jgi:selenocysteine lyase/cysteine desulfurase